jgi:hypothetical protein
MYIFYVYVIYRSLLISLYFYSPLKYTTNALDRNYFNPLTNGSLQINIIGRGIDDCFYFKQFCYELFLLYYELFL